MAYASKTEVQNYLGVSISDTLSTYISTLISAVTDYIERYCGGGVIEKREFEASNDDRTFYYDGNDATKLEIDDLRDITSLTVNFNTGSETALTEDDDYYLYPLNEDVKTRIELVQPFTRLNLNSRLQSSSPYVFDEGQKGVKVVGKFGYSTTPPDAIKLACLKLVGAIIKENIGDTDLKEITSESLGDYTANYVKIKDIAERLKVNDVLNPYKRVSVKPKMAIRNCA